jgi:hypothetical protein
MVTLAQGEDGASQSVAMLLKKWNSAHDSMKTAPKQQNGHTSDQCSIESHAGDTNAVAKAATAAPTLRADTHINACPFRHGSVGVKPFPVRLQPVRVVAHAWWSPATPPLLHAGRCSYCWRRHVNILGDNQHLLQGYVHGRNTKICPAGMAPHHGQAPSSSALPTTLAIYHGSPRRIVDMCECRYGDQASPERTDRVQGARSMASWAAARRPSRRSSGKRWNIRQAASPFHCMLHALQPCSRSLALTRHDLAPSYTGGLRRRSPMLLQTQHCHAALLDHGCLQCPQELYHHEKNSPEEVRAARVAEVLALIEATGTYAHTWDELQHGADALQCAVQHLRQLRTCPDRSTASAMDALVGFPSPPQMPPCRDRWRQCALCAWLFQLVMCICRCARRLAQCAQVLQPEVRHGAQPAGLPGLHHTGGGLLFSAQTRSQPLRHSAHPPDHSQSILQPQLQPVRPPGTAHLHSLLAELRC